MKAARISARTFVRIVLATALAGLGAGHAVADLVTPLSSAPDSLLPAPWQIVTLPKIPRHTQYEVVSIDPHPRGPDRVFTMIKAHD